VGVVKEILNISTARNQKRRAICSAIRQLRKIEFYYHGGYRTVEPFCLGIVMKGDADNESLLCYQTSGFSDLGDKVGWKLYRASEMEDIEVLRGKFSVSRPGFDPDDLEMERIICFARPVYDSAEDLKEPVGVPVMNPLPLARSLNHNALMERFRYAHPRTVTELDVTMLPGLLSKPLPERVESKIRPAAPNSGNTSSSGGSTRLKSS
jgi:hypothetical protein